MSTSSTPRLPASIPITRQQSALTAENIGSSPQWTPAGRSRSRGQSAPMDPAEEWARLFHAAERRKIQNRHAQRKYRQSLKKRLESLESQGAHVPAHNTSTSSSSSSASSRPREHFESRGRSTSSDSIMTLSLQEVCEQDRLQVPTESIRSQDDICPDVTPILHHRWSTSCIPTSEPFIPSNEIFDASMSHFDPTMFDMQHQTDFADLLDHTTITSEFGQYTQSTSGLGIANTIEPNPSQLVCQGDLLQPPPSFPSAQTTPNLPQQPTCSPRNHSPLLQPTGTNPMHLAAMRGFVPILEMLLAQGADVNEVDERGCTALHLAVEQGQEEAVRVLLKHGADFSAKVH